MSSVVVVTGLSGAGRSTAGAALEDAGWFVIDNLPPALTPKIIELASKGAEDKIALVVGRPSGYDYQMFVEMLEELKAAPVHAHLIFLDAQDDALVARFEGTKRRHPVSAEGIGEAIARERESLAPIQELADIVIDTSALTVHELKARVVAIFDGDPPSGRLQVLVTSFGFKYGLPRDADIVLDARFLPNPYWHSDLRERVGLDSAVRNFVLEQPITQEFLAHVFDLIDFLLPRFVDEGKSYLNVAIGCTGGRHRSVVVAEVVGTRISEAGYRLSVTHRDMER
ncbi:MAG: RNase adapter RapZ [Ferrimicrobium sp.]